MRNRGSTVEMNNMSNDSINPPQGSWLKSNPLMWALSSSWSRCRRKSKDNINQCTPLKSFYLSIFNKIDNDNELKGNITSNYNNSRSFKVLGIEIISWSAQAQYIFITTGVMLFLLLYGYLQELVVMNKFKRNFGWFVTLLQLSGYALCAAVQNQIVSGLFKF